MNEQQIFEQALELSAKDRSAFVTEACGEDQKLRERIERLLNLHDAGGEFFEQPAAHVLATEISPVTELPGDTIGPYKLLQQIGEGGMGVVYMAEQTHPVERRVALKIIKPGMDTRQVIARFEAERQALAMMDHPNIAKVLDAGTTDSGRPYFVMELVKGMPVTQYCDEQHLTPRERLELFVPICQALQHAHQKGIIHRDLKPSNILIARYDDKPVPKIIDFGVAKATSQRLTEKTMFTQYGQIVGTMEYMSPEQANFNQLDVDTRSDIYSLGVLLYELLTGETPFDKKRLRSAAFDELLRIIREEEPPRPSTRLSSSETLANTAINRKTEPKKLSLLVRGELDWIVMKALEKDRNRRYETANGFAADVQRYLTGEAVQAVPPSAGYRLRKFTRRHRVPMTVAFGFLLLLVTASIVSTYQAIRIRAEQENTLAQKLEADRQRNRAERERDRAVASEQKALTEARKSEQVAAFMTDMLMGVGPNVALGRDTTMLREILEKATRRLDQLKSQPAVEADLRMVIGSVHWELYQYREAATMFRTALALRRELLGNKHPDVARALVELGSVTKSTQLLSEGLEMQRELLGDTDPAVGYTLFKLGMNFSRMGRNADAENRLREALVIYRQHPNENAAPTLDMLALALTRQGKYAEAEPFARECVAMCRKQAPSGSPLLSFAIHNLGILFFDQHRYTEAEPYFREALGMQRKLLPPDHPNVLWSMGKLAQCLIASGQGGEEAVPLIDDFIRLAEGKAVLRDQISGLIRHRLRHFQKAKDAADCRTSAEMWERLDGTDPGFLYDAACFRAVTAAVLRATDDSPEAVKGAAVEADLAMDWLGKAVDAGYAKVAHMKQNKDLDALREREDFQELLSQAATNALAAARDAVRLQPQNPESYNLLGTLLLWQEKMLPEAEAAFREAIRLNPDFTAGRVNLAHVLMAQGRLAEAEAECREVLRIAPRDGAGHSQLGNVLSRQQKWPEAEAAYREALEIRRMQLPAGHNAILWSMHGLATSLIECDRGKEAVPLIDEFVRLADGKVGMRGRITSLINVRLRHFQKVRDAAGSGSTAEMWERLNRTDAASLYNAACFRAVTAAILRATDESPEAVKNAAAEADLSMDWLGKAIAAGYSNVAHIKQDKDLDALRDREDFKKLLAELENKKK